jgi:site-specific DNA-methyltransferase (adenine-specific)
MIILGDCYEEILKVGDSSVDLIIIDPPYNISKSSNFKKHSLTTPDELKTKYNISIDFGDWDKKEIDWENLFLQFKRVLKNGGTLIIFYDVWKSTELKECADRYKFNQHRVCCWMKTNPVPVNSKVNYLSNAAEYFFTFVKGKKPTFNSEYDNGYYTYPICHGKERYSHPTQKPLNLISDLIKKHTNEGDVVLDCFAGTGTTGHACVNLNRNFILIERDENYFDIIDKRLNLLNNL